MAPLQIILNDQGKRTKREEQAQETAEPSRNPFGGGDSSDSESEKPKVRQISSLSAARPRSPLRKPSPPPIPEPEKSGPKGSQIARLVARRKDAAAGLADESREARDEALFKYDVDRCEDEASAAGYEKRPVEGFGELMLRSMGWRGTADKGEEKEPTPRSARLGLGAKVEDQPPGLTRKRPRGKDNGVPEQRTSNTQGLLREDRRNADEEKGAESNPYTKAGVTAESEKIEGKVGGKGGFSGNASKLDGSARRRRRSRFADDTRR